MSKKMMKRSLALGALMAFVITGSAWASAPEGWTDSGGEDGITYVAGGNGVINNTIDYDSNVSFIGKLDNCDVDGGRITVKQNAVFKPLLGGIFGGMNNDGDNQGYKGSVSNCVVSIEGGDISAYRIVGGYCNDNSGGQEARNNSVTISGGTVKVVSEIVFEEYTFSVPHAGVMGGYMYGYGDVISNSVVISGGEVSGDVYGAYAEGTSAQYVGCINDNSVTIDKNADVEGANLFGSNLTADKTSGNTLNIKGGWEGSIGSAQNFNVINITEGSSVSFKTALNDNDVVVNVKGATWNVDKANTVGSAYFDATSTLEIDGATFANNDGKNNNYALNGSGTLTVEQGAKLKIESIKETTYNIATGFTNLEDAKDKWEVSDVNTLMQGVAWTSEEGLQVEVFAKKAEDIAEDMGVSVNIANTMTDIITAANENKNIEPGTPQAGVVDFANALADAAPEVAGQAVESVVKMAEEVGQSAIAASIVKNVTDITNDRLSFNCGHSAPQKGGHGVGLLEEGSGADVWVEYVHGKDEVENMKSTAGATSYEGQYNGFVMGVDFKKVNKFQSGIAFNYGEGDTNSVGSLTRTHSDYDFWGVGYYGNIRNDDSNVIFDINYAKTDSDVTQKNLTGDIEASPEATTWTAGVKVEKLYQNENVRIVPYTGLRYMSIDADDYSTKCGTYNYKMERKDIWLLPVGVSIKQEVTNDNGWTVSPRVDLSYIWAFGDTDSNMGFGHALDNKITNIGYDVMDDGSFLGLVGIEAHKGQWGYGVAYSYQKGDHSESKKWYVDVNYSF